MKRNQSRFTPARMAMDAVLIAMFFALSLLSIEIAGIKITFSALATMVGAILFGPADGLLIGLLGAFCEQLVKYGITVTTVLWILPPALRGLLLGLCMAKSRDRLLRGERILFFMAVCMISGLLVSMGNTLVYYVDAKLFHYYTFALIFGVFWVRIAVGLGSSLVMGLVTLPILKGLEKAGFPKREG